MASEDVWESDANPSSNTLEIRASRKNSSQLDSGSSSSELSLAIVEVSERLRKSCGIVQQSSLPGTEETKKRKLSTTSVDKNESRRSSIAALKIGSDGNNVISSEDSCTCLEPKSKTPESTRPSVSSTEDVSVIPPITAATPLPQQVTAVPQQPPTADTPSDKNKDNKTDSKTVRTNKKSQSGVRKRSSISTAPLISVSSVVEDVSVEAESTPAPPESSAEAAAASSEETNTPQTDVTEKVEQGEPSTVTNVAAEAGSEKTCDGKPKDPVVCPWEDE